MADFTIRRNAAASTLTSGLRAILFYKIECGWQHESGAWLVIASIPNFPDVYNVHWRATDYWGEGKLEFIDAFEDADKDRSWARALQSAESAWDAGPAEVLKERAAVSAGKRKTGQTEATTRGGHKSGEVRKEKAELVKTETDYVRKKYTMLNFYHLLAKYDPKVWKLDAPESGYRVVFNWSPRKGPKTFVTIHFENDDGNTAILSRSWHINGNEDNGMTFEKLIAENINVADGDAVCDRIRGLAERMLATDPLKWEPGQFGAPI
jgi:hypothetical protein